MGLFSSSSKSTAVSTTNVDEKNFNTQDTNAPVIQSTDEATTTVNITDQGIAQSAFDAFNMALDDVFDFAGSAVTGLSQATIQQSSEALSAANQISRSDTADTLNTLTKWLAGAAAVSIVAWAYFRGRK